MAVGRIGGKWQHSVMLELRPICENCTKPLPPYAADAMICSFECTFCEACVVDLLHNVCPNCGGGFERRPVRPATDLKGGNDTTHYPPSQSVRHRPVDTAAHAVFARDLALIEAGKR